MIVYADDMTTRDRKYLKNAITNNNNNKSRKVINKY